MTTLQEFEVSYIAIKMGNSPRPGVFALEKSPDGGKTWQPWQHFAGTYSKLTMQVSGFAKVSG